MDLTAIPIIIVLATLISASIFDLKKREVPDVHWWVIGIVGIVSMMIFNDFEPIQYLMVIGSVLILIDILVDLNKKLTIINYVAIAFLFIIPILFSFDSALTQQFAVIPICYLIFYFFYLTGMLKGGADAKCLIVMAIAFQKYPQLFETIIPIPKNMELIVAYPISLLFHAALFSMLSIFYIIFMKIKNSDSFKNITTYKMPIENAKKSHVWLKQDVIDRCIIDVPEADAEAYERLEKFGVKNVKVSMIIPFIVPITLAYIFMLTIGNILFIPFM